MNRAERKEFLRKLAGRMPRIFGGGGCTCKSCKATNRLQNSGFDKWPTGNPAGRQSQANYASHVSHSFAGSIKRTACGPAGAGYYGTPEGSTKAEVDAVLRATFVGVPVPYDARDDEPQEVIVKKSPPRLLSLARELRDQRNAEQRAQRQRKAA